jgi:hypothetical protein
VVLTEHYARDFSAARRLACCSRCRASCPASAGALRSHFLMKVAVRMMGNLVTDEDADWIARAWRSAGRVSRRFDERAPFS